MTLSFPYCLLIGLSVLEVAAGLSAVWLVKVILQKYVALTSVSDSLK